MNRRQATKALLKGCTSIGETTTPWGTEVVVTHYWIVPKVWLDEATLAHARVDLDDIPATGVTDSFFEKHMALTSDHAELAWPMHLDVGTYAMGLALHNPDHPSQTMYVYAVRGEVGAVNAAWFDALDDLSRHAGCDDLFVWSKGPVAPIIYADADENPVAVLMSIRPSSGVAAGLAEFVDGLS